MNRYRLIVMAKAEDHDGARQLADEIDVNDTESDIEVQSVRIEELLPSGRFAPVARCTACTDLGYVIGNGSLRVERCISCGKYPDDATANLACYNKSVGG